MSIKKSHLTSACDIVQCSDEVLVSNIVAETDVRHTFCILAIQAVGAKLIPSSYDKCL